MLRMGSSLSVPPTADGTIVAVCGFNREASLLKHRDIHCVVSGGVRSLLEQRLASLSHARTRGIISVGICGALDSKLAVGDCVIASEIVAGFARLSVDTAWSERLTACLPESIAGPIAGTDSMLIEPRDKQTLRRRSNALAADMESYVAAEFAATHGIPFAALRVVSDDAHHALPPAVLKAMKPDGGVNIPAVIGSLMRNPLQLPALLRTARDSEIALKVLLCCLDRLGPRLLGPDLG
jgi:adenosylhomocysteine nucleosidase